MEDSRPDPSNDARPEGTGKRGSSKKMTNRSASRRNRSFLTKMGESFKRSGGERGADIDTLRGTRGAEFEGRAQVVRGEAWGDCGGCCGDSDETEDKLLLIKGTYCFVFFDDEDKAPKYAISLAKLKPIVRDSKNGRTVVTLEKNKEVEYEISFEDAKIAKTFRDTVVKQAALFKAEDKAKNRGQGSMLAKHSSVRYAEAVAKKKVQSQPEKETGLSAEDVMVAGS